MNERHEAMNSEDSGMAPQNRRGLYWNALSPEWQKVYEESQAEGLDGEIVLLRMIILRTLSTFPRDYGLLAQELRTLARLERTNAYFQRMERSKFAVSQELRQLGLTVSRNNPGIA